MYVTSVSSVHFVQYLEVLLPILFVLYFALVIVDNIPIYLIVIVSNIVIQ